MRNKSSKFFALLIAVLLCINFLPINVNASGTMRESLSVGDKKTLYASGQSNGAWESFGYPYVVIVSQNSYSCEIEVKKYPGVTPIIVRYSYHKYVPVGKFFRVQREVVDYQITVKAPTPEVSFNGNGGTVAISSKEVKFGETYGTLPDAYWSGYEFLGWYTTRNAGQRITASTSVKEEKDHVLYAHWKEVRNQNRETSAAETEQNSKPAIKESESETVAKESEPETVAKESEPEREPETIAKESEPETVIKETEPETVIKESESQRETEPERESESAAPNLKPDRENNSGYPDREPKEGDPDPTDETAAVLPSGSADDDDSSIALEHTVEVETNTLQAEMDGVPVTFYLEKAYIADWGRIIVVYVSYDDNGEKQYQFHLSLDDAIEPGTYRFEKGSDLNSSFYVYTQYYKTRKRSGGYDEKWGKDYKTSYTRGSGAFAITERDSSCEHYQGTLDLYMEFTSRYPDIHVTGDFDFTVLR